MRREWGQGFFIYYLTIYNLLFSPLADFFFILTQISRISRNELHRKEFSQPVGLQPSVCSRTVARAKRLASVRFVRSV